MREKSNSLQLIEKIVDREHDHSDLQARKILHEKLSKKSLGELQEIWERGENE
jgi:hypothetical protein